MRLGRFCHDEPAENRASNAEAAHEDREDGSGRESRRPEDHPELTKPDGLIGQCAGAGAEKEGGWCRGAAAHQTAAMLHIVESFRECSRDSRCFLDQHQTAPYTRLTTRMPVDRPLPRCFSATFFGRNE